MTEQTIEKQTETKNMKFASCVIRTTGHYYKTILIWGGIMVIGVAIAYGVIIAGLTILPPIVEQTISGLTAVPIWVYIPVGIITIPALTAIIVCYIKRNDNEIRKADEKYVCHEE